MDLKQLRYFVAVAEYEHVSLAARTLHLSQSPLSRQIAQLEKELGVGLFEHVRKRVRLTSAGRQMLIGARALLEQADRLRTDARRLGQGEAGPLDIGYVPTAIYEGTLASLLHQIEKVYPAIQPRLHPMLSAQQIDHLENGKLDIGLLYPPVDASDLEIRHLLHDPVVILAPEKHEIARARRITPALLKKQRWITAPAWTDWEQREAFHESDIRRGLHTACRHMGFEPNIAYDTLDPATALSLIASGFGITLAQRSMANGARGIVARKMPYLKINLELVAAWRPSALSGAAAAVLRLLVIDPSHQNKPGRKGEIS